MKRLKISLLFIIIINIFTLKVDSGELNRFVILSGSVAKIECEVKDDVESNYVSTKGTGTITFIDPVTKKFAAVAHPINSDVCELEGNIYYSSVSTINKSKVGMVGSLKSQIKSEVIGDVRKNNDFGVFGECNLDRIENKDKVIEVARRNEIQEGPATLYVDFGDGSKVEYNIEISQVINSESGNMDFEIKIQDDELVEKTGGIVRGMSGSPVIQNGKLIGALARTTNNNPNIGYGIYADKMLNECESLK